MGSIKKFKSFEEANKSGLEEFYKNPLDKRKTENFLQQVARLIKNPYKPGLYRFRTFKEADEFDLQQFVQQAGKKSA